MLKRNLAAGVVGRHPQQAVSRQTFPLKVSEPFQERRVEQIPTAGVTVVHPENSGVDQSLVFCFRHVQSSPFCSLWTSFHGFYHLHSRTNALAPMQEQKIRTKNVAWCSESHHTALEINNVLNVALREHTVS